MFVVILNQFDFFFTCLRGLFLRWFQTNQSDTQESATNDVQTSQIDQLKSLFGGDSSDEEEEDNKTPAEVEQKSNDDDQVKEDVRNSIRVFLIFNKYSLLIHLQKADDAEKNESETPVEVDPATEFVGGDESAQTTAQREPVIAECSMPILPRHNPASTVSFYVL